MIAPLRELQSLTLSADGAGTYSPSTSDPFLVRIRNAVQYMVAPAFATGPADIAGLLRQGMLRCQLAFGEEAELRVPRGDGWPSERIWNQCSCDVTAAGPRHFLVRPRRWKPSWLDPDAAKVVEDAIGEISRREPHPVPSDPLVSELTGHATYASLGQRAAVHAAFLIPPGSTAILNLPTGAGKTLAFQLPALAWASQGGLTLVVVPTTALAKDQEQRFRSLHEQLATSRAQSGIPLAYHGGLDQDSKNAIKAALRDGSLPIIFASAEAVMGALRGPLFEVARQGRLKTFAVDEAHIVTQWGQQFRPEFQSIAGLKDALLDACPPTAKFRTLLLTATLTSECCETLKQLFGNGGCQIVSEAALRAEPAFLLESISGESERIAHVMEAIWHLPKPLVLYTTLREHAENWHARLQSAGFSRMRLVRGGDLADASGDEVLRDWRGSAIDIIVATSAFGLGMDQQEVRSVVHACLPESIDRYYQEVGRAGRDGRAAVALIVSTRDDIGIAESLSNERLIGIDRAFERWDAMWVHHRRIEEQTYVLSLDDRPPDISDTSPKNASWNLRTLVLMARAGLITFAAHPPPAIDRGLNEDDETFEERRRSVLERFSREVAVRISDPRHSDKAHWDDVVVATRTTLRSSDEEGIRLVRELRNLQRPLNEIFRQVYTIEEPLIRPPRFVGSCPVTRRLGTVSFNSPEPELLPIAETSAAISAEFARALLPCTDDANRSWISFEEPAEGSREERRWRELVLRLLRYSVAGGVVELEVPNGILDGRDWSRISTSAPLRLLIRAAADADERRTPAVAVPRISLLGEKSVKPSDVERVMMVCRPKHIIVLPRSAPDPTRPGRPLLDIVRHLTIQDLLSRLQ